jgi:GTPase SAR1 family protein
VDVVIAMYDITDLTSFRNLRYWLDFATPCLTEKSSIFLVGGKCDLEEHRHVSYEMARNMADEIGIHFLEVSSNSGMNTEYLLHRAIEECEK